MASIKDVAKKSGVSIGTIDRVVHNRGRVSKKTSDKVHKVIKDLGYKPNLYARNLSLSKTYLIAVLMPLPEEDSTYWELSLKGIEKASRELKPCHVKVKVFHYDRYCDESFLLQSKALLRAKPDGILVAPVAWKFVHDFFQKIPAYIPYVLFNANIPHINARSFIGQDAHLSGFVCGKLMSLMIGTRRTIAVIISSKDDYHVVERADGFSHFFESNPNVTVTTHSLPDMGNRASFFNLIKKIIAATPDLAGIFVTNSSTHFVAEYLKKHGADRKIPLVGYDLIAQNIQYLKEGYIDFLISQKPETQGYEGVYTLYRNVVLQQPCQANVLMPIDIVIKENLIHYS